MSTEINRHIAAKLRDMASVLEQQDEDGFRIKAYRAAADAIDTLAEGVDTILAREGRAGLIALPSIGAGVTAAITEMLTTGRWAQLDRVTGALEPEQLFQTIPGTGRELSARIHEYLHVDTLEQLEVAAHDGRLESVPGFGPRRAAAMRAFLADRLGRRRLRPRPQGIGPPIELLLAVDASYRAKAAAGALRKIAPKRFNASGEAWLPILHETHGNWSFTALFSNTQKAHQLNKTSDWVVIYSHDGASPEGQFTVVTETHGALKGRRVVRGREAECAKFY